MAERIVPVKIIRWIITIALVCAGITAFGWWYTAAQLERASAKGVYTSAEEGMLALMDQGYAPDKQVRIVYAGTNSFDGSDPFIWYVIAEVRASANHMVSEPWC